VQTRAQDAVHGLLEGFARPARLRPKLGGHIVVEGYCCSHIMMLYLEHHDVKLRPVTVPEAAGRPVEAMDAFLAATAQVHQLTLVTRNTAHFHPILKSLLNPWS
jgi:hypothetical protein